MLDRSRPADSQVPKCVMTCTVLMFLVGDYTSSHLYTGHDHNRWLPLIPEWYALSIELLVPTFIYIPSIYTRQSATCLFLCTSFHRTSPFGVLVLLHGTPRASLGTT
jgi:hypothetical protein